MLTWATMEQYIKDYPTELDPIQKEIAESDGYKYWESVVMDSAKGDNKQANTATLQMLMRNKYGWDRTNHPDPDAQATVSIQHNQHCILAQLSDLQQIAKSPVIDVIAVSE